MRKENLCIWKVIEIIGKVRQAKSENKQSMKAEIILTLSKSDYKTLGKVLDDLQSVTRAKEIKQGKFDVDFV
jgi:valyl-tRNA synthetase